MSLCVGAVHRKASAAHRVIDKVNRCAAQIINRDFIDNDLDPVGFERCVYIAEVVIECVAGFDSPARGRGPSSLHQTHGFAVGWKIEALRAASASLHNC